MALFKADADDRINRGVVAGKTVDHVLANSHASSVSHWGRNCKFADQWARLSDRSLLLVMVIPSLPPLDAVEGPPRSVVVGKISGCLPFRFVRDEFEGAPVVVAAVELTPLFPALTPDSADLAEVEVESDLDDA